ncbi:Zinc finger protein 84 [Holothuria leucospilota]|uniref:Zinc finger protein 84 n=1 Tax=Holothuria leucospilota TaxID=206669 RepID=A0A9Q1CN43_HOLLE|nr:Zinc finger protein 84 [Holothuria leucospilota]
MAHLVVKVNNCEHVLCYLEKGISHQQGLDFIFQEGDNLTLSVEGTSVMHISGYSVRRSMPEDIQHDGSMIARVKAELDETQDDMDSTISFEDQQEMYDASFTLAERRQGEIRSQQQCVKVEKDNDEECDINYCEILEDPAVCEDNEGETSSLQISAEDIEQLQRANRTEIDFSDQELQKTLRVVLTNAKGEKFHTNFERRQIEYKIADDARCNKTDSNSTLQEDGSQDKCRLSERHSPEPSLEKQIKEEPNQGEGDHSQYQDVECEDIDDALLCENSEGVEFLNHNSANTSHLQTPNEMEVCLNDASSQETSVQLKDGFGNEKEDTHNLEPNEPSVDLSARACSNTHKQESNQGMEMTGADIDDTSHSGLCSENEEEENQPDSPESVLRKALQQLRDELPVSDSSHQETSADAKEGDNDCQTCVGRLEKSVVTSPKIGKSPDFLTGCDTGELQSPSILTVRQPGNRKRSLESLEATTTQQPQQSKTSESAASESSITEGEETSINRNQYKCTECEKTFRRRVSLLHHRKTHTVPEMQKCQSCNRFFSPKDVLYEGKTTSHGNFQCQICENKSVNQSEKRHHLTNGHIGQAFKCHMCKMSFASMRRLIIHKIKHNVKNQFLCQFCGKVFTGKQNLHVHERIHKNDRPFECQFCGKMFVQKIQMILHERKYHIDEQLVDSHSSPPKRIVKKHVTKRARIRSGKRPFKCQFCSKRFLAKHHALEHERIHTGEKPFKCKVCGKGFAAKGNATKHEKTVHTGGNPFKGQVCAERFNEKSQLTQHEEIHTGEREYESSFSNQAFQDDNGRITHEKILTNERPFKCSLCEKRYFTKSHLSQHKKIHTGKRSFKCQFCGKAFFAKQHVLRHEKIHTRDRPFKCRYCAKGFIQKHHLTGHERVHTGARTFKCHFCAQRFFTKGGVLKHEITHAGENSFKCQFCPKRFLVEKSLKRHEKTHTDERKFKCSFCNQGFRRNTYRIDHERIHTNERPYKCSFCPKKFIQRSHVICHERIHTRERPFECSFCGEMFSQKSALNYHEGAHAKQEAIKTKA